MRKLERKLSFAFVQLLEKKIGKKFSHPNAVKKYNEENVESRCQSPSGCGNKQFRKRLAF